MAPQVHELRFGPGDHQRAPKRVDGLIDRSLLRFDPASRNRDELRSPEIEAGDLQRRQEAAVRIVHPTVCTRQREAGAQERALGNRRSQAGASMPRMDPQRTVDSRT